MKIKVSKVFASYMKKQLPKDYNITVIEVTDDTAIALLGRDRFWNTQSQDFNDNTRLTKVIKITYPDEYYAMPNYICTDELSEMFKRDGVTDIDSLNKMITNNFIIQRNIKMKNNRLYYSNQKGKYGGLQFNCWGATAFILGLEDRLRWIEIREIGNLLECCTTIISDREIKRGDILTIYGKYCLEHTAVYLGRGRYFHKMGGLNSEITDLNGVYEIYGNTKVEYRRVV